MNMENDSELELELSDFTSLIYSKNKNEYYIDTFSDDYEEKYEIIVNINDIKNVKCCDCTVTTSDILQFVDFCSKRLENI